MGSINTNFAAMTALQTLSATNKNLATTQDRISTGFRVGQASDNAAYWSIATEMRSDNKSMGAVQDALGFGAAQVDVAYTAMDAVKNTLDTMKAKLVAASQPDIDKAKIQEEIKQLQNDLKTYAQAATFSGGNWLDVQQTGTQKIVASFNRSSSGVSLSTIDVDTSKIALFTANSTGLLQGVANLGGGGGVEEPSEAPDVSALSETGTVADAANEDFTFAGFTELEWAAGDTVAFNIAVDGSDVAVTGSFDGTAWTFDHTDPSNFTITFDTSGSDLVVNIANAGGSDPAAVTIDQFTSTRPAASTGTPIAGVSDIADGTGTIATADPTVATVAGFAAIEWQDGDTVTFTVGVPGENSDDPYEITGTYSADSGWSFSGNPAEISIEVNGDGELVVTADAGFGTDGETMTVGNFEGSREAPAAAGVNVTNFDITTLDRDQIQSLINHVDGVLKSVTSAASELGAIKTRVDTQKDFIGKIMDAVDRGVSQLVDADMQKESARLSALQVQQQLGVQALSIANSGTQTILSLFR